MILSLSKKGFKNYSGYISQLFFLLCLMIVLVAKDVGGGLALSISFGGIFLLVILPMFLQRQIDVLVAENRLNEIEFLARMKANLAWSELNAHLHRIAEITSEIEEEQNTVVDNLRSLLGKGQPFDEMTRVFLGLIHFNQRNFSFIIQDLIEEGKPYGEYTFEEQLYLVRAFLETGDYERAAEVQLALEANLNGDDFSEEKRANLVISRMIFFAFMGWLDEFENLLKSGESGIERLPPPLIDFWTGIARFNSGDFVTGEKIMAHVISQNAVEGNEMWLPFMRQRYHGLLDNKELLSEKLLPILKELNKKYSQQIVATAEASVTSIPVIELKEQVTNILTWLTMIVSVSLIMARNMEDVVNLVAMGANSSYLVNLGQYYRLFTYQFIHIGWTHLLMNLFALKFFGPPVETVTGWPIFLGIYFFSGVCGGLAAVVYGQALSVGASAAVLGLLSAAIVLQLFRVKGSGILVQKSNFSTLMFILFLNLMVGLVEKGVDNSAHLGGLAGGAVFGLLLAVILNFQKLKKAFEIFVIISLVSLTGFSLFQGYKYSGELQYPNGVSIFREVTNASGTLEIMLPDGWVVENASAPMETQGFSATGPFKERMNVLIGLNTEKVETFLNDFVKRKTSSFESMSDLKFISRKGPAKNPGRSEDTYRIRWAVTADGRPLAEVDYLMFERDLFCLVQFFVGTEHTQEYKKSMDIIVNSIKFKNSLSLWSD